VAELPSLKIHIHHDSVAVDDQSRAKLHRRLEFALSSLDDRIGQVVVWLSPDGSAGAARVLRCEIEVKLRPRAVRVADTGKTLTNAIENAAARLGRSVARAVERERGWADETATTAAPRVRAPAPAPATRRRRK
jgi:ribosome-associated translation inhibitor RaiA